MGSTRIAGMILLIAGVLALVYGGFSFTKAKHSTSVGPFSFSVKQEETVNIPLWAGIGAFVAGAALLLVPRRG